jgi:hypothetical protein
LNQINNSLAPPSAGFFISLITPYPPSISPKWGFSGFMGAGGEEDFTCRCDQCTSSRRKRWQKEQG